MKPLSTNHSTATKRAPMALLLPWLYGAALLLPCHALATNDTAVVPEEDLFAPIDPALPATDDKPLSPLLNDEAKPLAPSSDAAAPSFTPPKKKTATPSELPPLPAAAAPPAPEAPTIPPVNVTMPKAAPAPADPVVTPPIPQQPQQIPTPTETVAMPAQAPEPPQTGALAPLDFDAQQQAENPPPSPPFKTAPAPLAKPEAPLASSPQHLDGTSKQKPKELSDEALPTTRFPPHVSSRTEDIIGRLPSSLGEAKEAESRHNLPVDIKHGDQESLFPEDGYSDNANVGASVTQGRFNPTMEERLNKAYEGLMLGQNEAAVSLYRLILAEQPTHKLAMFGLATSLHRNGQYQQAQKAYAELLAVYPDYTEGLNNFFALMSDIAPSDAIKQLNALGSRDPDFAPIPAQLGMIYIKLGDNSMAAHYLARAVALAPENITYRLNLAIALDKMEHYSEAIKLYTQVIEEAKRGTPMDASAKSIQERLSFLRSKAL